MGKVENQCIDADGVVNPDIVDAIVDEWGIDEAMVDDIINAGCLENLDMNMIIDSNGFVTAHSNGEDIKKEIFTFLLENPLNELEYIFIDGERVDVNINIGFTKHEYSI